MGIAAASVCSCDVWGLRADRLLLTHLGRSARRVGRPVEVGLAGDAFFPIGLRFYWKSHLLTEITDEAVEATVSHFDKVPSPRSTLIFQQFGGAFGRVGRSETAFWHRDVQWDNFATSAWTEPAESDAQLQWVREWWNLMRPFSMGGEYANNLAEEEDRVQASYGGNYERLVALKTKYDPPTSSASTRTSRRRYEPPVAYGRPLRGSRGHDERCSAMAGYVRRCIGDLGANRSADSPTMA